MTTKRQPAALQVLVVKLALVVRLVLVVKLVLAVKLAQRVQAALVTPRVTLLQHVRGWAIAR